MLRNFMYLSIGVLCLAVAFHLGAESARADLGADNFVSISQVQDAGGVKKWVALTSTGEVYWTFAQTTPNVRLWLPEMLIWESIGSIATPVTPSSWGQIKGEFRD